MNYVIADILLQVSTKGYSCYCNISASSTLGLIDVFFNSLGREEAAASVRVSTCYLQDKFIVGFGLFTGFVKNKKDRVRPGLSFRSMSVWSLLRRPWSLHGSKNQLSQSPDRQISPFLKDKW